MFVACSEDKEDGPLPVGDEWIDPVFAQVLQERGYIADAKTVTPLDVADIKVIDVSGGAIKSLRGISHFTNLCYLDCAYNQLDAIDVTKNKALIELYCYINELTSLDVSKNTALTMLSCGRNPGNVNGLFVVKAWFDSSNIPENFTTGSWYYNGQQVTVEYQTGE